jgi:hypothetical protein
MSGPVELERRIADDATIETDGRGEASPGGLDTSLGSVLV